MAFYRHDGRVASVVNLAFTLLGLHVLHYVWQVGMGVGAVSLPEDWKRRRKRGEGRDAALNNSKSF